MPEVPRIGKATEPLKWAQSQDVLGTEARYRRPRCYDQGCAQHGHGSGVPGVDRSGREGHGRAEDHSDAKPSQRGSRRQKATS